ncbi:type II toxin-antitoxin system RelE/ParE family toxin [Arcobacter vandammei]|uniref:type II toxin-antitoxin system RelE/ParE family toxin n=1 Tax=Arcobacter vandammei TaxID=2782243 RepID=UPI0018DF00CA|nr:type II toxin-antitoxin system RelE/ParE family toxin [Arcobacter vandammei]
MFNIEKNITFNDNLFSIIKYIAKNSPENAKNFKNKLDKRIRNIPNMPFKARKSFYFEDENVRDLIFKGYTIPYYIDINKNLIILIDIFKWQNR